MIKNEFNEIEYVITHRPDKGISNLTPLKAPEMLYDDIVFLEKMQQEHDTFTSVINKTRNKQCTHEFQKLLSNVLLFTGVEKELIDYFKKFDIKKYFGLEHEALAELLITGMDDKGNIVFSPVPNLLFTRDIGVTFNKNILLSSFATKARIREGFLFRLVVNYHPDFKDFKIIEGNSNLSVEGGDVLIYSEDTIFIGHSERTSKASIEWIRDYLFEKKIVKNVVVVDIPKERRCMHLDTVFTFIDKSTGIGYAPFTNSNKLVDITLFNISNSTPTKFDTFQDCLEHFEPGFQIIPCGNGNYPAQDNEQWTDGCNTFAISPGVVMLYERNTETLKAFQNAGFQNLSYNDPKIGPNLEKTVITIPASELSRARGGPHCMTMPLKRKIL